MRTPFSLTRLLALAAGLMACSHVLASEESQLINAINAYRSQIQLCAGQPSQELPPLSADTRLILPSNGFGDLQQALSRAAYPMVNVQAITLSGPRDVQAAMNAVQESFCRVVLDPQFVDIGVSRDQREWRIVLARPLLSSGLGDWQAEGQKMLDLLNSARTQPHQCGAQAFNPTTALTWSASLGTAAQTHTLDMANNNYFDHKDRTGGTPGDRAELSGYIAQHIGENIAAGLDTPRKVVDGWLASPGHCANIMNPAFSELGAAYAVDPKSDAGIYWTALFGTQ